MARVWQKSKKKKKKGGNTSRYIYTVRECSAMPRRSFTCTLIQFCGFAKSEIAIKSESAASAAQQLKSSHNPRDELLSCCCLCIASRSRHSTTTTTCRQVRGFALGDSLATQLLL